VTPLFLSFCAVPPGGERKMNQRSRWFPNSSHLLERSVWFNLLFLCVRSPAKQSYVATDWRYIENVVDVLPRLLLTFAVWTWIWGRKVTARRFVGGRRPRRKGWSWCTLHICWNAGTWLHFFIHISFYASIPSCMVICKGELSRFTISHSSDLLLFSFQQWRWLFPG
jgi:hypothetical protein